VELHVEGLVAVVGVDGERNVNSYVARGADSIGAIITLILDRRVPPPAEMQDVIGGGYSEAYPCRPGREHEKIETWRSLLEPIDDVLT
jgi:hypothetical protein